MNVNEKGRDKFKRLYSDSIQPGLSTPRSLASLCSMVGIKP